MSIYLLHRPNAALRQPDGPPTGEDLEPAHRRTSSFALRSVVELPCVHDHTQVTRRESCVVADRFGRPVVVDRLAVTGPGAFDQITGLHRLPPDQGGEDVEKGGHRDAHHEEQPHRHLENLTVRGQHRRCAGLHLLPVHVASLLGQYTTVQAQCMGRLVLVTAHPTNHDEERGADRDEK